MYIYIYTNIISYFVYVYNDIWWERIWAKKTCPGSNLPFAKVDHSTTHHIIGASNLLISLPGRCKILRLCRGNLVTQGQVMENYLKVAGIFQILGVTMGHRKICPIALVLRSNICTTARSSIWSVGPLEPNDCYTNSKETLETKIASFWVVSKQGTPQSHDYCSHASNPTCSWIGVESTIFT